MQSSCLSIDEQINKLRYTHAKEYYSAIKRNTCWEPVAHAYYPSYSGGRDQEDQGLKPAQGTSSRDPISKKIPSQKKG
jgi:hypothetical protein